MLIPGLFLLLWQLCGGPDLPGDVIAFVQVFQLLWMHSGELVVTGVALDIVLEIQLLSQDYGGPHLPGVLLFFHQELLLHVFIER
ncbi:UNVERIFIED_CONTAM: hypothetical protein NCL1_35600 [Trichonephila clavipes]